jgi:hypothetical protein
VRHPRLLHSIRIIPVRNPLTCSLHISLTAGFGALAGSIFTLFNDYRGVSYASTPFSHHVMV